MPEYFTALSETNYSMPVSFSIVRSARKTIAIYVRSGSVVVRAPRFVSKSFITEFVQRKTPWIEAQLLKQSTHSTHRSDMQWFLGEHCPIRIVDDYARTMAFTGSEFTISKFKLRLLPTLRVDWYRRRAQEYIFPLVEKYSEILAVYPQKVTITSAKTRLGSCSSRGTIHFSWRLMYAPLFVVEYVVVHELVHMLHHNHSARFWKAVFQVFPQAISAKKWVKTHAFLFEQ